MRAAEVAKLVSQAWKDLPDVQRSIFVEMGRRDRERYEHEKASYKGPWKVPDVKDPSAPKKPMSAFLAFGNERRGIIAEANPNLTGTEISALLSKLWKECPIEVKQTYRNREAREREEFKKKYAEWENKRDAEFIADHQSFGDDASQTSQEVQKQERHQSIPASYSSWETCTKGTGLLFDSFFPIDIMHNEHMVSIDSLDNYDVYEEDDNTLEELMEDNQWPLEKHVPRSIVLPKISTFTTSIPLTVNGSTKFDNYSLDDVLQDEDLFFEDFSPSAVASNNDDNNNAMAIPSSNSSLIPDVNQIGKLGCLSVGGVGVPTWTNFW